MSKTAHRSEQAATPNAAGAAPADAEILSLRRIPRVTIHAFCSTSETAAVLEHASRDRRMARAQLSVRQGGTAAAVSAYREAPTPDLIIVEGQAGEDLIAGLDALAAVCDVGTKVLVIGQSNDIGLYRELLKRGISEYLPGPVGELEVISAISGVYSDAATEKFGRICAFIGARGGVGSSTIAQNVAWSIGQRFGAGVILADMDLAFGTAALNCNLEPEHGIGEAVQDTDRLDEIMLERLLTRCGEHLNLLSAPAMLDTPHDLDADAFEPVLDLAQSMAPYVVLDMPHIWTGWSRKTLITADEVVITATPDLASLRNTKHLLDLLRQARPNDAPPKLVLNQLNAPKRPEIKPEEFAKALQLKPTATLPFDPKLFGQAAIDGKMIGDVSAGSAASASFASLAQAVTGRTGREERRPGLRGILEKLNPARRPF